MMNAVVANLSTLCQKKGPTNDTPTYGILTASQKPSAKECLHAFSLQQCEGVSL